MGSKMEAEFRNCTGTLVQAAEFRDCRGALVQTIEFNAKKKLPPRYTLDGITYRVHYDTKTGEFCYQQSNL